MRLSERIRTTLRADAHGMVDAVQDRELLLKQMLRDAEVALDDNRTQLDALTHQHQELTVQHQRLSHELNELDRDVNQALARGADELARYAAKRYLQTKNNRQTVAHQLEDAARQRDELVEVLATQEKKLEQLRAAVHSRLSRLRRDDPCDLVGETVGKEDVELELLRRQRDNHSDGGQP